MDDADMGQASLFPRLACSKHKIMDMIQDDALLQNVDSNSQDFKTFKAAFDIWNAPPRSQNPHLAYEIQVKLLFAWASHNGGALTSLTDQTLYYQNWFQPYADCESYDVLWAQVWMTLPPKVLSILLQVDPTWTQPDDFIHVPVVPASACPLMDQVEVMIKEYRWNAVMVHEEGTDGLAALTYWAVLHLSSEQQQLTQAKILLQNPCADALRTMFDSLQILFHSQRKEGQST